MITFFDYLYLTFYDMYDNGEGKEPELEASIFLSGFQTLNTGSIFLLYEILVEKATKTNMPKRLLVAILLFLIVFNYIRYIRIKKFHYTEIRKRWDKKTKSNQKFNKDLHLAYLGISIVVIVYVVYYFASRVKR